jgi:3-isopropylmalate/(R)-2-methylmalate dehydratase small subunit
VIAESYARIFRQNMFNCGMMAVTLPEELIDRLFHRFAGSASTLQADLHRAAVQFTSEEAEEEIDFTLSDFDRTLVEAGGWLEFADSHY